MPAGDARDAFDAMLRDKAEQARHDPGNAALPATDPPSRPGPLTGEPAVSRVIYALRDLGVEGQATAVDVLGVCGGAGLSGVQTKVVLAAFATQLRPVGPAYIPPGLVGPDHPVHDEGDEDPPGVAWAERH